MHAKKGLRYICGTCGAQLSGLGDWVEHACSTATTKDPAYIRQTYGRGWRPGTSDVHRQRTGTNHIRTASLPPTESFEQLLTYDDVAWMRDIEKAFR